MNQVDQQYLDLLTRIKDKGTYKPAAREGMPGTVSLFGHQMRFDLSEGFPALTTKKLFFKGVVAELIWFLRGDTNIKFLVDRGCNIWNEDAYNYYLKIIKKYPNSPEIQHHLGTWDKYQPYTFEEFIAVVKGETLHEAKKVSAHKNYTLGDCGFQYGKVWRAWDGPRAQTKNTPQFIDQIQNVINSLQTNPESRRHIVTAIDPAHDQNLALYWCHAMFQFNCRPLTIEQRTALYVEAHPTWVSKFEHEFYDGHNIPKYYLDCQLYQRSADVVLGVPFNIASYALLTHIIAKIVSMVPGEFIHTFGDVHIYDNHMAAVDEQLNRTPFNLPTLEMHQRVGEYAEEIPSFTLEEVVNEEISFSLNNYQSHPAIKAELSTGLKK